MKIPLNWIKEYIPMNVKPDKLAEMLTMSGTAIEGIDDVGNCSVLSAEITTNRPDCLSLLGLAREISSLTDKKVQFPKSPRSRKKSSNSKGVLPLNVCIEDKEGCMAYTAQAFEDVEVAPSPSWLSEKLSWMGQKSVNNIVDITNFCLFETGQPLHAFDYDKIQGSSIIIRRAKKGEKIIGINDVEYELDPGILVIADQSRPIAIAGVMGGKNTEVTSSTKRIVLESARFNPSLVRHASRQLKLTSDSSYRFERSISPEKVLQCSNRCSDLFVEHANAQIASKFWSLGILNSKKNPWITLSTERLESILGMAIPLSRVTSILKSLGFSVKKTSAKAIQVQAPQDRSDIHQEADLVEEIIRIHGFDKIPTAIPHTTHVLNAGAGSEEYNQIKLLKESLVSQGFWEVVTFSVLSKDSLRRIQFPDSETIIRIKNPLSQEQEYLRPNGLVGLLSSTSHNMNRKEKDVALFEIGKRFFRNKEENILSLMISGQINKSWTQNQDSSFYYLKGIIENVFSLLKKPTPTWKPESIFPQTYSEGLNVQSNQDELGYVGSIQENILNEWNIAQPTFYAEILLDNVLKLPCIKSRFVDLPKFPAVRRDIAFVVDKKWEVSAIEDCIREAGGEALTRIALFDQFIGKSIPKGKRSLAFSLQYQKANATFTDAEIQQIHDTIITALKSKFSIDLR